MMHGLEKYIRTTVESSDIPVYVFDDHNHAFFAWREALEEGRIAKGARLIHFDTHDDSLTPTADMIKPVEIAGDFPTMQEAAHLARDYDIDGFIYPAIQMGLIGEFIWVDPNHKEPPLQVRNPSNVQMRQRAALVRLGINDLSTYLANNPSSEKPIVDIDVDYFAKIPHTSERESRDLDTMRSYMKDAGVVTVATSPGYILQLKAIQLAKKLVRPK
jgi:hypothetical protein